ncbi:MAG: hypothetical protein R2688_05205 [Fimbriimonadaceae bacterium]
MLLFSIFEMEGLESLSGFKIIPKEYELQTKRYIDFRKMIKRERYELVDVAGVTRIQNNDGTVFTSGDPYQTIHDMMYVHPVMYLWKRKDLIEKPSSGTSTP